MPKRYGDYYYRAGDKSAKQAWGEGVVTVVTTGVTAADRMVLVGLGSNRGDSIGILREAAGRLEDFAAGKLRRSRVFRTSPVDCPPDSDDFLNAAVAFAPRPGLAPEALLSSLKAIERDFGREAARVRNAPRELDLDLLLFGAEQRASEHFTLPHPRAVNRLFVLAPAVEVLPDAVWPGTCQTISQLLDALVTDERIEPLADAL